VATDQKRFSTRDVQGAALDLAVASPSPFLKEPFLKILCQPTDDFV
jgi:hypothetical protein